MLEYLQDKGFSFLILVNFKSCEVLTTDESEIESGGKIHLKVRISIRKSRISKLKAKNPLLNSAVNLGGSKMRFRKFQS